MIHPWPAPVNSLRRIFASLNASAAIVTLPFLAGVTACERHEEAGADAVVHPASSPLPSATPAATTLADNATPAVTVTATATASSSIASPGPAVSASVEPMAATPAAPTPSASTSPSAAATAIAASPASASTPPAVPAASTSPEPSATGDSGPGGPTPVPAPHFASAAANEYVQVYDAYVQNFRTAYIRMMKDADLSEYGRLIAQAQELQVKGEQIEEELEPGEREAFGKYLDAKAEEISRITSEAL